MKTIDPVRNAYGNRKIVVPSRGNNQIRPLALSVSPESQIKHVNQDVQLTPREEKPVAVVHSAQDGRIDITHEMSSTVNKAMLLEQVSQKHIPINKSSNRQKWFTATSGVFVALLISITGYVSYDTWLTNQKVKSQFSPATVYASEKTEEKQTEKKKNTKTIDQLAGYKVAPEKPRAIYIDSIGVRSRVVEVGVDGNGAMAAPDFAYDAGWYKKSSLPGEAGAVVLDGHSAENGYGIFGKLHTLPIGETLRIERGDGKIFTYKIVAKKTYRKDNVDMEKAINPYDGVNNGLNIITCTGEWLSDQETLDKRIVVFTEQV